MVQFGAAQRNAGCPLAKARRTSCEVFARVFARVCSLRSARRKGAADLFASRIPPDRVEFGYGVIGLLGG